MLDGWTEDEKGWLAVGMLLAGLSAGGAFSAAVFGAAIQRWLVEVGVLLQGPNVLIALPWADDVGLDLPRLLIAVGVGLVLLIVFVAVLVGLRRQEARKR
ncbi:hypothetical protein [Clavibacter michiganensis]|uniref:hypothetical protein n=1 Tax=Clavibacter michiganensis TaxID=28447 RepID=UPI00292E107D|nr:hypothetical protein [Clavibacter michiganensis]